MLKRLPSDQLEEESKLALKKLINQVNWKLVDISDDKFGIDEIVQIVKGFEYTGKSFQYQIKVGKSYISSENGDIIKIRIERKYILQLHIRLEIYHGFSKASNRTLVFLVYHFITRKTSIEMIYSLRWLMFMLIIVMDLFCKGRKQSI
jgi:hypothetical protein